MENALKATFELMSDQPLYYTREALFLIASCNSRDSTDVFETITRVSEGMIIVNMISLISQTYIFQNICKTTKGKYEVALNEHDFKTKLMKYALPVDRVPEKTQNTLFMVSFPKLKYSNAQVMCSNTNELM